MAASPVLGAGQMALATSDAWTGAGGDALWSNSLNWSTNPAAVPGTGDTATFNAPAGAGGAVIDLGAGITINNVTFDTAAAAYTIGAGAVNSQALTLNNTGSVNMSAAVVTDQLINAAITLGTDATAQTYTITNASTTNLLTLGGSLTSGVGGTAGSKTIAVAGAGNVTLGGTLVKGTSSGIILTSTSTGTLRLNGSGTVLQTLNVNALGIVDIGANPLVITNGGGNSIQSTTGGTINATGGGTISITGNSATDGGNFGTANATTLNVNAKITSSNSNAVEFFNVNNGTGVVVLTAANDFTGNVQINSGIISVATIGNPGSTTSNLGQGTTINIGNSTTTTGTLRYTGGGESPTRTINLSGTTAGGIIDQSGSGTLTLANLTFGGSGAKSLTLTGSTTSLGRITANIVNSAGGATSIVKQGSGTWELAGNNTYTGNTTINSGTNGKLLITSASGAGNGGQLTSASGATTPFFQLHIDGAGSNGNIDMNNAFGGNSNVTATIDVDNNGGANTGNTIRLMASPGGWGTATLNVTGANGYGLFINGIRNTAGTAGTQTFNPSTAPLTIGTLTGAQATGTNTFALNGSNTANAVTGTISDSSAGAVSNVSKAGAGTWVLSGTNTYTGTTTVTAGILLAARPASLSGHTVAGKVSASAGTLAVAVGGASEWTSADIDTLRTNATFSGTAQLGFDTTNAPVAGFTYASNIGGTVGVNKLGAGTLTLSGAGTYTGTTTVTSGTLTVGAVNALGPTTPVLMGVGVSPGNLNIDANQTISSLTFQTNNAPAASSVTIASGQTLTITPGATAGAAALTFGNAATAGANVSGVITGPGSLVINNTNANVITMTNTSNTAPNSSQTLDMTGLGSLTATVANFDIGSGGGRPVSQVTLADSSTITATLFRFANSTGTATGGSFLRLGQTATINADTITIANARQSADLSFRSGLAASPVPLFTVRATDTTGRANLALGNNSTTFSASGGGSSAPTVNADLTAGSVDFFLNELVLGIAGSTASNLVGHGVGNLTFNRGTIDATTVTLGRLLDIGSSGSDTSAAIHGTINMQGGTLTAGSIMMAENRDGSGGINALIRGALNISGGAATVGGDITVATHTLTTNFSSGASTATVSLTGGSLSVGGSLTEGDTGNNVSTLTLEGGDLDMTGGTIKVDTFNLRSGVLRNLAQFNSGATTGAALNKTAGAGDNTLKLEGTLSYTGSTTVSSGTMLVNGAVTNTSSLSITGTSTLGGTGTVSPIGAAATNAVTLDSGTTLAPGASIGTLTVDSAGTSATSVLSLASGAILSFELNSGLQSDRVAILDAATGDVSFGGNTINFTDLSGGGLTNGPHVLFTASAANAYAGLTVDGGNNITSGLTIGTGLGAYAGSTLQVVGNDIVLNVVPEPGTLSLLGLSTAGLLSRRRRRE